MKIVKEEREKKKRKEERKKKSPEGINRRELTELRSWGLPDIDYAQSCLIAHEAHVIFAVLVRIKPVELFTFLDDAAHLLKLHIFLGPEEEAMTSSGLILQLREEFPILLTKPFLTCQTIGMFEAIQEELVVEVVARVVGVPDLLLVVGKSVAVHSN